MGDFLRTVLAFLVVLGPLVLIHELGHFIAARLVGITVLEFGFGFPPRAVTLFEQGGTKFTLNWLPIGGFVRPLGEDFVKPVGDDATEKERKAFEEYQAEIDAVGAKRVKTKSVNEATPLQRIFFMVSGAAMNFLGAFILLVIAAMLGRPVVQSAALTVVTTAKFSPASGAGLQAGDIITHANGNPVNLAQDLDKEMSARKTLTLTYKRGNESAEVKLPPAPQGDFSPESNGVMITEVSADSPAAEVFQIGDVITKIDKEAVTSTDSLKAYVDSHAGESITVTFTRNDKSQTAPIVPRKAPPAGQGAMGVTIVETGTDPVYGLLVEERDQVTAMERAPLGQAISIGWLQFGDMVNRVVSAPIQIIRGRLSAAEARPVSAVGIAQMSNQVLQKSLDDGEAYPILGFAAVISIALAVTNLLPIPALDGGRILFVLIEILRGKPLDPEREGMVHLVGLMLLLGLSAILIVNDLLNPISLGLK
jgi:regulator of sigma E protease